MSQNKLILNQDKSQIILLDKDKKLKKEFEIKLGGKIICHSREVTILGNLLNRPIILGTTHNKKCHPIIKKQNMNLENNIKISRQSVQKNICKLPI